MLVPLESVKWLGEEQSDGRALNLEMFSRESTAPEGPRLPLGPVRIDCASFDSSQQGELWPEQSGLDSLADPGFVSPHAPRASSPALLVWVPAVLPDPAISPHISFLHSVCRPPRHCSSRWYPGNSRSKDLCLVSSPAWWVPGASSLNTAASLCRRWIDSLPGVLALPV